MSLGIATHAVPESHLASLINTFQTESFDTLGFTSTNHVEINHTFGSASIQIDVDAMGTHCDDVSTSAKTLLFGDLSTSEPRKFGETSNRVCANVSEISVDVSHLIERILTNAVSSATVIVNLRIIQGVICT